MLVLLSLCGYVLDALSLKTPADNRRLNADLLVQVSV
jgi:hypothetical protein